MRSFVVGLRIYFAVDMLKIKVVKFLFQQMQKIQWKARARDEPLSVTYKIMDRDLFNKSNEK